MVRKGLIELFLRFKRAGSSGVECSLGMGEVGGSSPPRSTILVSNEMFRKGVSSTANCANSLLKSVT